MKNAVGGSLKQSFWLKSSAYHVTLDGKTVRDHKVAYYGGYNRTKKHASPEKARAHYDELVARYAEVVAAEKGVKPARGAAKAKGPARAKKLVAPKLKSSKPLTATELERLGAKLCADAKPKPWKRSDFDAVEGALGKRHRFRLPASFRAYAERFGASDSDNVRVLSPKDVVRDTKNLVRVPRGTTWSSEDGPEVRIEVEHLVAFAADGPEARWCFCIDPPAREPAIYYHHQDEPRARIAEPGPEQGGWIDARSAKPDYADFAAWLRAHARAR